MVDTSAYFGQVTVERTQFIRHCFGEGQALFFDGFGWLQVREALFSWSHAGLWEVSPVGISQDGRHALVYAEHVWGGSFYLFERRGEAWVIAGTSVRWIS